MATLDRSTLLEGDLHARRTPIRPPWAIAEAALRRTCTGCGTCVGACPERILRRARGGAPVLDFARGACTFCGACVVACPEGALARKDGAAPWNRVAAIGSACLERRGIACRACEERCARDAIRFRPAPGGRTVAAIDDAACTGCGACVGACPAEAITIDPPAARVSAPRTRVA